MATDAPRRRVALIESPMTARAECPRCRRPVSVCYCAALTTLDTVTRVVILQHPRESGMPIGTAHMAQLCLPNAKLHVGLEWDESPVLDAALGDAARPAVLLWPGHGARNVLTDPPAGPVTLIVVDGTWSQARKIVRSNPRLAALPRYAFDAPEPTHYRIRKEPRAEYVSTIEALIHVLGVLEGDPGRFRALLGPMDAMVDAHLAKQPGTACRRFRHPPPGGWDRSPYPPEITERFGDLVCVAAEANAWPVASGRPRNELIHWVARRVATGETFDVVAAPPDEMAPGTPRHSELPEDRILAGVPRAELVASWERWVRPTDVICAWGSYGPDLLDANGGVLPAARVDVRTAARRLGGSIGSIEDYAARVAGETARADVSGAPLPEGRAGRRLGMLVRIARAWRAEADAAAV